MQVGFQEHEATFAALTELAGLTGRPPQLLLTLLGDYWWQCELALPSAALVSLLAEFGVSDIAARAALSRLVQHHLLITSRRGRQTLYRLSERAMRILTDGGRRIFCFGQPSRPWNGVWSMVAFSIPEENRQLRHVLRDRLRWLGFAPLYNGLWISPRDCLGEVSSEIADLSIHTITLFRASIADTTPDAGLPPRAWDLATLRTQYQQFMKNAQPLVSRMTSGEMSPQEALRARTQTMGDWRGFPALDPDLPDELLPPDWPRTLARQLFITVYDALGPLAQQYVQEIIARYDPEIATQATYHSFEALFI